MGEEFMIRFRWLMLPCLVATASSLAAPPIGVAELDARQTVQHQSLTDIHKEIVTLLANRATLDRSPTLKAEEARSLRTRFPMIRVSESFNASQFVAALRNEEQRQRVELGTTLRQLVIAQRANACAAIKRLKDSAIALESSDAWPLLTLEERLAARSLVAESIQASLRDNGDVCLPYVDPPESMNMEADPTMAYPDKE